MLTLRDPHVRLVLLSHFAARAASGEKSDLQAAGIHGDQITRLLELNTMDLIALAEMPTFSIAVAFELDRLEAALRTASMLSQARSLEAYFIKNGASSRMMYALFKSRKVLTRQRRREQGCWMPPGRTRLPERALREQILRVWCSIKQRDSRLRYYLLHRSFPHVAIAVLEAVILADDHAT
jgi:hypothetical protein